MSLKHPILRDVLVLSSQILVSAMLSLLTIMNEEAWTTRAYLFHNAQRHKANGRSGAVAILILHFATRGIQTRVFYPWVVSLLYLINRSLGGAQNTF
jgi:hypothetical protein